MSRKLLSSMFVILGCAAGMHLLATPSARAEKSDPEGRANLMNEIEQALTAESWKKADSLMRRFRALYPPSSRVKRWENGNEVAYLFPSTMRLATHYEALGDLEKTLALYNAELADLSPEVPHYSWGFIGLRVPIMLELGRPSIDEIRRDLERHRELFERNGDKADSPGRRGLFQGLVSRMTSALRHLDLVGRPAPSFDFVRAYNAKLPVSLADYRGKVVVIDFWATWCLPCMAAWPKLQELYRAHHEEGLEILGVTSLEGSYGKETPEREVQLTEQLIEQHRIEWPILFSTRAVNDPLYSATALPTYAIIDRAGNVERILVGSFDGLAERVIERLLEPAAVPPR